MQRLQAFLWFCTLIHDEQLREGFTRGHRDVGAPNVVTGACISSLRLFVYALLPVPFCTSFDSSSPVSNREKQLCSWGLSERSQKLMLFFPGRWVWNEVLQKTSSCFVTRFYGANYLRWFSVRSTLTIMQYCSCLADVTALIWSWCLWHSSFFCDQRITGHFTWPIPHSRLLFIVFNWCPCSLLCQCALVFLGFSYSSYYFK